MAYEDSSYFHEGTFKLYITSLSVSITVNALVTGMIVFRILKAMEFWGVKPTSVQRTVGSSTGGTKFRHIIFVIIESAMALFAIQLVRVVLSSIPVPPVQVPFIKGVQIIVIFINQMLIVIILKSVHIYIFCFADSDNVYLSRALHQQ